MQLLFYQTKIRKNKDHGSGQEQDGGKEKKRKKIKKDTGLSGITLNVCNSRVLDLRTQEFLSPMKSSTQSRRMDDRDDISSIFLVTIYKRWTYCCVIEVLKY